MKEEIVKPSSTSSKPINNHFKKKEQKMIETIEQKNVLVPTRKNGCVVDHNFFSVIDTPAKAYVLGWFASDGSMRKRSYEIAFKLKDLEILELIAREMKSTHKISPVKGESTFQLVIYSKQICADLEALGYPRGSKRDLALIPKIPEYLLSHFIRGFMDGDGSIYFNGNGRTLVLSFAGQEGMLLLVKDLLQNVIPFEDAGTVGIKKYKDHRKPSYDLVYHSRNAIAALDWIYQEHNGLVLQRKLDRYLNWVDEHGDQYHDVNIETRREDEEDMEP